MKKNIAPFIILTMLSGCWCGIEEKDPSGVGEYFSGCWGKLKGEKTQNNGQYKKPDSGHNPSN